MTRTVCWLAMLACASLMFAQAPAKLVVKNAFILTMANGQREPVKGYLVVGADGRISAVAAGDPPPGLQAKDSVDAGGHWVIPG
jgi:5-methylthioadenosine/S-adenosylhomocysteine deaminase